MDKGLDNKIYYVGDPKRGKEIIESLQHLGGHNGTYHLDGTNRDYSYFINDNGIIDEKPKDSEWLYKNRKEAKLPPRDNKTFDLFDKVIYQDIYMGIWRPEFYYKLLNDKGELDSEIDMVLPFNEDTCKLLYKEE